MEVSLIADAVTVAAYQGLGFAKSLLHRHDFAAEQSSSAGTLQIAAAIFPVDAVAPPPVKSNYLKTAPRTFVRRRRRTRRRSQTGGGPEEGEDGWFFGDAGGGDGPFGGGPGGGGGWNSDRFGWSDWDESSSDSPSDPAFDFVYEVMCWIALSNCLHFAFKKVVRIVADGFGDPAREKVPVRLTPVC
ncbi:uncharacterized protein LOC127811759 [Diospyros lotus]|uniref:uncharacterized protein LOC127811759 n=1 Tax=Diospyros lotus TaxID=55363 RepID=UPI002259ED3A|nr:uncharacterized protein LOC127811759 [Diospyros lotus]